MERFFQAASSISEGVRASQSSVLDLIVSKARDSYDGERLRDRLILLILAGGSLHSYVVASGSHHGADSVARGVVLGLVAALPVGLAFHVDTTRRIHGNLYVEPPRSRSLRWLRRGALLLVVAMPYVLPRRGISSAAFYELCSVPVTLLLPVSCVSVLAWLIAYERRNGAVYVVADDSRA